jgi:hypothetical protein
LGLQHRRIPFRHILTLIVTQGRVLFVIFIVDVVILMLLHLELLGYAVLLAQSQKAFAAEMHVVVSRDEAHAAVAHSEVPTDQWADSRSSCGW